MATLKTTFAGLELRNPIIVSSSGLTDSAEKNQKFYEAGVGAIVLKSLFEEQIMLEADQLKDPAFYPEASDYLAEYIREHKLSEYLTLIKESKKECPIPIIASINCYSDSEWIDFAKQIEAAGADALEINILALQSDVQYTYGSFEQRHIDILRHIKKTINIPVIMKLGDNLTNPVPKHPVIDLMEEQKGITAKGGTMRLGAYPCSLEPGSKAAQAYGTTQIQERHRHRYEFNSEYLKDFESHGMKAVGANPDTGLVEVVEIPDHPWFVGTQYHPEYKSTVQRPHPLFVAFVAAALAGKDDKKK